MLDERTADPRQIIAELRRERDEALAREAAMAEVLQVINASPGDLAPVFDAILERAMRLCEAAYGTFARFDGENVCIEAFRDVPAPLMDFLREPQRIHPGTAADRLKRGERSVHVPDTTADPRSLSEPRYRAYVELGGARSILAVPLRKEGRSLGALVAYRQEVRPFTEKQIELLESFAAQAVIAMENARLITETREALEQQTATAEVLQVINASPGDLAPVFEAILEKAHSLCGAETGSLQIYEGEIFRAVATRGLPEKQVERLRQGVRPGIAHPASHSLNGADFIQIPDISEIDHPLMRIAFQVGGIRTYLSVPLRKDDRLLGRIVAGRRQVRLFTDQQIALLQNFAAQAVIAMENARLLGELRERTRDLEESLEYQTATSDVLKVISRSTFDLQPVLDAVTQTSVRLCTADSGHLAIRQGEGYRAVATCGVRAEHEPGLRSRVFLPGRDTVIGRSLLERRIVHVADLAADPEYGVPSAINVGGSRTVIAVPLVREGEPIGVMALSRRRVEPFTERQIELIRTFADQAVIAIENTRLINETREALEQQTATAEVLQVINSSPGDLAPVFDAMVEKAVRLCGAAHGTLRTFDGEALHLAAMAREPEVVARVRHTGPVRLQRGSPFEPFARGEQMIHVMDARETPGYQEFAATRERIDAAGIRTLLAVALRKEDALVGVLSVFRQEVRPFSEREIALLENFAAQAVIAMDNARLLNELRDRTHDLQESLEYQTAISDVLKVISQSTFDLEPVLDRLIETATRLCGTERGLIATRDGEVYKVMSTFGASPEFDAFLRRLTIVPSRGTITGRTLLERRVVQVDDLANDPEYSLPEIGRRFLPAHTSMGVPLLREGEPIGVVVLARNRIEPFTERQIELVTTFADQAVIAIENARLLNEIRQRQAELRVTFENMGDGVAMFDGEMRLAAWNMNFQQILELPDDFLAQRPTFAEYFRYLAARGEYQSNELETEIGRYVEDPGHEARFERTRPDGRIIEVRRNAVPGGGFVLIYSDVTERKRAESEIRAARDASDKALSDLKAAQASLLHAQKMSALGQLTAGIAHEIKNPLNFVNNFAGLSNELLGELKEMASPALESLDADTRADIDETIDMLSGNLDKIAEHGQRADNIVKSMLAHSRGSSGERTQTNLNALVDEALNLAYHGARANDQNFNITMERDFDASLALVELVPQDMMRVFLNLIGNGFHAAHQRRQESADPGFRPVLSVATRDIGDAVEVRVRDNGTGILPEHRDRLFQPFFTTKPTGEGTGLGLSISYDIVTQEHGGTITAESEPGMFTEFTVRLPKSGRIQSADTAAGRAA